MQLSTCLVDRRSEHALRLGLLASAAVLRWILRATILGISSTYVAVQGRIALDEEGKVNWVGEKAREIRIYMRFRRKECCQ